MKQTIIALPETKPLATTRPLCRLPDPELNVFERGTTEPRKIGDVMEPIQRIIKHPGRNRLMAEFFKKHW